MKPTACLSRSARTLVFAAVLPALLSVGPCAAAYASEAPAVQAGQATVTVDGLKCPEPGAGVRIVSGDADVCPTSVDQVLSEQDPAEVPLSLALMGGAMLGLLFMRGRRR